MIQWHALCALREEFENALKLLEQPMVVVPYRDFLTARALNKNLLNILFYIYITYIY